MVLPGLAAFYVAERDSHPAQDTTMPLIFVDYPQGALPDDALDSLAEWLTRDSLECEGLPDTPFVRSTIWIYFRAHPAGRVYQGPGRASTKIISCEVNVFEGGLDASAKSEVIVRMTQAIRQAAGLGEATLVPVYTVFRDVADTNRGVFGTTTTLAALIAAPVDTRPV